MPSFIYFILGILIWFAIVAFANSLDNQRSTTQYNPSVGKIPVYNGAGGGMRAYRNPGTGTI